MVRLIAGAAGGRRLKVPPSATVRPTPDRVREALFSILADRCLEARVLDACAGTGALGLEALSRGAVEAVFVEKNPRTAALLRDNVASIGLEKATIIQGDVLKSGARLASKGGGFDLVFVDPPYRLELWEPIVDLLVARDLLARGAMVVIEHPVGVEPDLRGVDRVERRRYGDVVLSFFERERKPVNSDLSSPTPPSTVADGLAIYPGSFDPITNGHIDVIQRGLDVFPKLIVAVAHNPRKSPMFTTEERVTMIREALPERKGLEVDSFEGLLVEYARRRGARVILRGLRAVADFEYEFQMANMNKKLSPEMETLFMMTGENYFFLSSHNVREVATFGGALDDLVPDNVARALRDKFA